MIVTAQLRDGTKVTLAASCGATPEQVVDRLTGNALTGSAVALDESELVTDTGRVVRFGEITNLGRQE